MSDHPDEHTIDKLKDEYRAYLQTQTFDELVEVLPFCLDELIEAIMEDDPTGKDNPEYDDTRNEK